MDLPSSNSCCSRISCVLIQASFVGNFSILFNVNEHYEVPDNRLRITLFVYTISVFFSLFIIITLCPKEAVLDFFPNSPISPMQF